MRRDLEDGPFAGLAAGGYRVIVADPPWSFSTFSAKGQGKSPQAHYSTMDLQAIKALPVRDLAHSDGCALFMWATAPMLPQAFEVLAAWGFTYKTMGAWAKRAKRGSTWAFGTGYIYRSAVEPWIVGTRGNMRARSRSIRNLQDGRVREHSRKPDQMRRDVERLFDGPYLELFAREPAPGWAAWGNEKEKFAPPPLLRAMEAA